MTGEAGDTAVLSVVVGHFDPLVHRGLIEALREDRRVWLLASDLDDAELEREVGRRGPQVAILDETVEHSLLVRLKSRQPATAVLVFAQDTLLLRTMLVAAGATFLARSSSIEELTTAVHLAAQRVRGDLSDDDPRAEQVERGYPIAEPPLTPRETEVLKHLGQGKTHAQIAFEMKISVRTVHVHAGQVYRKLRVAGMRELSAMPIPSGPQAG